MNEPRPFKDLQDTGLLWLINRTTFHPRGFSLALHVDKDGEVVGWVLLGNGRTPYIFSHHIDDEHFIASQRELKRLSNI